MRAGEAVAERARWEHDLTRVLEAPMDRLLAATEQEALTAFTIDGRVLLAAPRAFTLGPVLARWQRDVVPTAVDWLTEKVGDAGPQAVKYVRDFTAQANDSDTPIHLFTRFRDALTEGVERGDVRERVERVTIEADRDNPQTVMARNAVTAAYAFATLERLAGIGHTHKRWVSYKDTRTRPTHKRADGQVVPIDATFRVGGFSLAVPGDPTAPAIERAGCRCVVVAAPAPVA